MILFKIEGFMSASFRVLKIDHIGIALTDTSRTRHFFSKLSIPFLGGEEVSEQKVTTEMYDVDGSHLELLKATQDDSPIAKFITKKGEGIHHIALRVDNLQNAIQELTSTGIELIDKVPRIGAGGKIIAFIHPKSTGGILIELSQEIEVNQTSQEIL